MTNNTSDFFTKDASAPHPDILAEAETRTGGHWKMLFHRSLDDFIVHFDSDRAASSEALQRALISDTFAGFDLWEWVEANLLQVFPGGDELDMVDWAGFPIDAEAPLLQDVEEVVSLDIPRIRHVRDDIYRAYCDLAFIGHFHGSIGYASAESVVHPNQTLWKDETDSFWTEVGIRAAGTIMIAVDLDVKRKHVVDYLALPLQHWSTYQSAIDQLEQVRDELNQVMSRDQDDEKEE